ncbi:MAG: polyprenyl synthetase family protein [Limnochordia bacterium]|jgi:heptaprenyl diphosphate synthase|nr:polyprenyl synthetase family protein [Limnochordia bacterium]MDD2628765.1 polyprenyl synthetase family protein [Limnochordia bacterium]MDD4517722.1 polyprenyl synthetase family protein [Limnochordia bacterium]
MGGMGTALTFKDTIEEQITEVEACLLEVVASESEAMTELATHLLSSGKRVRPRLVLLCADLFKPVGRAAVEVAASVELIHMASLIHDDIIDHAHMRRERPSVNARWGNHLAVLAGDFLFSRAYQVLTRHVGYGVVPVITNAIGDMCIGEVEQARSLFDVAQTEEMYYRRILGKTASLIRASCKAGALIGQGPEALIETVAYYGEQIGYAFQIIDDVLDFIPRASTGKSVGLDLLQGIITLPIILLLRDGSKGCKLKEAIRRRKSDDALWQEACTQLEHTGCLSRARDRAKQHIFMAKQALAPIPDSSAKTSLLTLADELLARSW